MKDTYLTPTTCRSNDIAVLSKLLPTATLQPNFLASCKASGSSARTRITNLIYITITAYNQGCMQKCFQGEGGGGGQIWGTDKRGGGGGGAQAYVRCYTLYLLGGGGGVTSLCEVLHPILTRGVRMTQGGGGQMPIPAPPLNTALIMQRLSYIAPNFRGLKLPCTVSYTDNNHCCSNRYAHRAKHFRG